MNQEPGFPKYHSRYAQMLLNNHCITIGSGCVIAAGSVVIHDCEDNCLYAGNPAKKIKELPIEI